MFTKSTLRPLALLTPLALTAAALADPRDSATFTNVNSAGAEGDPGNQTRTATFAGGYTAHRIRIEGTLSELETSTLASEARIRVIPPSGPSVVLQPFTTAGFVGSIDVPADTKQYLLPPIATTTGTWTFRFFESFADGLGADANWNTITITLDDAPAPALPTATFVEVEGNSNKATANRPELSPGDQGGAGSVIGGATTGSSTAVTTLASADYFRVRTVPAPLAIYKHQLTLTTRLPGLGATIRGLSQSDGVINQTSDTALQTSIALPNTDRLSQWYGFGRSEELYYRVTGTSATTDEYRAVYTRTDVVPTDLTAEPFEGPSLTISSVNSSILDTDLWVYDESLNAIPGFGNDEAPIGPQSTLTRDFNPGTYYVAISTFNVANDQPSPTDDDFRNGGVLDFPNALLCTSSSTDANVSFSIAGASGTPRNVVATKANAFDVVWVKFAVSGTAACPADVDDGTQTGTSDGAVTIEDLIYFLVAFENGSLDADLDDGTRTGTLDGAVTIDDLIFFLIRFEEGC